MKDTACTKLDYIQMNFLRLLQLYAIADAEQMGRKNGVHHAYPVMAMVQACALLECITNNANSRLKFEEDLLFNSLKCSQLSVHNTS